MKLLLLVTCLIIYATAVLARPGAAPRPPWAEKARFARWLVHESNYTVLASRSAHLGGAPFPNLLATSDGRGWDDCTGQVYMYFGQMMSVYEDIQKSPTVTLGFFEVPSLVPHGIV